MKVLAFVPTTATKARAVTLWEENNDENSIYKSVLAAVRAANDFIELAIKQKATPDFCSVHGNVVLDERKDTVYKCFFDTSRRKSNIELIQNFVDPEAKVAHLGPRGCYVKMKWVGLMLSKGGTCSMCSFLQIARELERLHRMGYCHGDIRVSNLILHPKESGQAKLVDFDLSGKTGQQTYPSSLLNLVDGARNPTVKEAIQSETIGRVNLFPEHDWFSLAAAMKCFDATNENDTELWKEFIEQIEQKSGSCALDEAVLTDKTVKLKDDIRNTPKATGSPGQAVTG